MTGKSVVPGHAAFRYSLMSPSHQLVWSTARVARATSGGSSGGAGRSLVERLVGSVLVVVVDVAGDKALKLVLVPDNRCVWCPETRSLLVRRHFGTRG